MSAPSATPASPATSQPFARSEYAARLQSTRDAMARDGLDALIVTDPSNMNWLTGYDGWSFYVHQAVVIGHEGEPLLWLRAQDVAGGRQTSWVSEDSLLTYPEEHVQNPPHHPYETLVAHLAERGLASGRIGAEFDNYYFSAACLEILRRDAREAEVVDATGLVNWRRAVKSPAELALMREAGAITAAIHAAVRGAIGPGARKNDVVAEALAAGARGASGAAGPFGGDYPAIMPIAPSGREASASHITWNDREMIRGEATYFEVSGCRRRYHCPASRTYFLGEPPAEIRRAEEAVLEAIEAAFAAARPGATCEEVASRVYAAFRARGFEKGNRTGYPVGVSYPPDWGERTMSLRPGDATPLEVGMTFHLMPGLWTPDWGVAITDTFEVTEQGGRPLMDAPREIFTLA